jgi:hypothetical protein
MLPEQHETGLKGAEKVKMRNERASSVNVEQLSRRAAAVTR